MDHLLLHPHPSVTAAARHFVSDWSRRHRLSEDTVERLELLTSEVVANAVIHGLDPSTAPAVQPPAGQCAGAGHAPATTSTTAAGTTRVTTAGARSTPRGDLGGYVLVSITDGPDLPPDVRPDLRPGQPADERAGRRTDERTDHRTDQAGGTGSGQAPCPGGVLVCVSDPGTGRPRLRTLTEDDTGGRGLALVDLLATAWGVSAAVAPGRCYPAPPLAAAGLGGATGGKTTWFLLTP
ncbi:ATP-binding protein [Kineococcus sp. TBRC 1896]|uniref:ATP-binding protein n=1 Tax=Kineococcus mangrovi TaxID=1660183 RepID=A0ABV4I0M0_9ACTN